VDKGILLPGTYPLPLLHSSSQDSA
jgi:hypothetical protein